MDMLQDSFRQYLQKNRGYSNSGQIGKLVSNGWSTSTFKCNNSPRNAKRPMGRITNQLLLTNIY